MDELIARAVAEKRLLMETSGYKALPAAISFTDSNRVVQVTPQGVLPAATLLAVAVDGVKDVSGNAVSVSTTTFTTGNAPATVSPSVLSTNPPDASTNVPTNLALAVGTNSVMDLTTITSNTLLGNAL